MKIFAGDGHIILVHACSEPSMKIYFLSLNSYPILTGKNLGCAGGAEVEQVHLPEELLFYGSDVFHYVSCKVEGSCSP